MSNYCLCETCAVKHVGGEMQSFLPFFSCSAKPTSMAGMVPIADGETPREVCPYYKPKVMNDEAWNTRADDYKQAAEYWQRMYEQAFAERTCKVIEEQHNYYGYQTQMDDYTFSLSCGHVVTWDDLPDYCPNCGAKVVDE